MCLESEVCIPYKASRLRLSLNSFLEGYIFVLEKLHAIFIDTKSNSSLFSFPVLIHVFLVHSSNTI